MKFASDHMKFASDHMKFASDHMKFASDHMKFATSMAFSFITFMLFWFLFLSSYIWLYVLYAFV